MSTVLSTASRRQLCGVVAEGDCRPSVAGDQGGACDDGLDGTAAEGTAHPEDHSPPPRPARRRSVAHQVRFKRPGHLHAAVRQVVGVSSRCRGVAVLQSRDPRYPVENVTRAQVSRSYLVGEIRRRRCQPRAEISRHLQLP